MSFSAPTRPAGPQATADYCYDLTDDGLLSIIDLDLGQRSVSNDMANVLADIAQKEGRTLAGVPVTYRDSDGDWCRVLLSPEGHYEQICGFGLVVKDEAEALRRLRELAAE